jgi:hypothetical protein
MDRVEGAIALLGIIAGWLGPTAAGVAVIAVIVWLLSRRSKD